MFLVAVMHFIPDTGSRDIVATVRDALAPGSYLVICHACRDEQPSLATSFETVYNNRVTAHLIMRSREEITSLCDGFTVHETGLVWIPQWRPDSPDDVPEDPSKYWALVASPATTGRRPPWRPRTDGSATGQAGSERDPTGRFGVPVPVGDDEALFTERAVAHVIQDWSAHRAVFSRADRRIRGSPLVEAAALVPLGAASASTSSQLMP